MNTKIGFLPQKESVMKALWPESSDVDLSLIQASQYVADSAHEFRLRKKTLLNQSKGGKVSSLFNGFFLFFMK